MINHGRTLLLNVSGSLSPEDPYPGEQIVPENFYARILTSPLRAGRAMLLGDNPDRAMMNWRLQELLTCIHSVGLADYLTFLDPRVTYWPFNNDLYLRFLAGPTATQTFGATQSLTFIRYQAEATPGDRIYLQWKLRVIDPTTVEIQSTNDAGQVVIDTETYSFDAGISTVVELPGAPLAVRFSQVTNTRWDLAWLLPPRRPLAETITEISSKLNQVIREAIFGDGNDEPYRTFQNLWDNNEQLPHRAAGLTLAVIYRLNGG